MSGSPSPVYVAGNDGGGNDADDCFFLIMQKTMTQAMISRFIFLYSLPNCWGGGRGGSRILFIFDPLVPLTLLALLIYLVVFRWLCSHGSSLNSMMGGIYLSFPWLPLLACLSCLPCPTRLTHNTCLACCICLT